MARARDEAGRAKERDYKRAYRARKKAEAAASLSVPQPPARKRPSSTTHQRAVARMLRTTGLDQVAEEAPLVELVKHLAELLDAGAEPGVRSAYRAALSDVRRVLAYTARPTSTTAPPPPPEPTEHIAPVNKLAEFRASRRIY